VHRLRERSRLLRTVVLLSIAVLFVVAAIALYRFKLRLIDVPYELLALALGAWLARWATRRKTT
jgi:hypothetical protein